MTSPELDLAELRATAEAAKKAAPGDWEEDACMDGSYRHSQVLFLNDRGQAVSLCDTLNAYHNLDPDERRKIGEHIARFDPPTVLALIKRVEDAEARAASWELATKTWVDVAQGKESALAAAQKRIEGLESALLHVRTKAIPAGAAFVRNHPDRNQIVTEVLDIIDAVLGGAAARALDKGEGE